MLTRPQSCCVKNIFNNSGDVSLTSLIFGAPLIFTVLSIIGFLFHLPLLYLIVIATSIVTILIHSYHEIRNGNFSLEYITLLALFVSAGTGEYLAGAIIGTMFAIGRVFEKYTLARVLKPLKDFLDFIPKTALIKKGVSKTQETPITSVHEGDIVVVHNGNVVPLDGWLLSENAVLNISKLTNEQAPKIILRDAFIRSGSINTGKTFEFLVANTSATSTYHRVVSLVTRAKVGRAHFVRSAEKANTPFTILILAVALGTYLITRDPSRTLAVLAVATTRSLTIATPLAFFGGISQTLRSNIIIKHPSVLESLAKASDIFFDKTRTLTFGSIHFVAVDLYSSDFSATSALAYASALGLHSTHPLSEAVVKTAHICETPIYFATKVTEQSKRGINGYIDGMPVSLTHTISQKTDYDIALTLSVNEIPYATLFFAENIDTDTKKQFLKLSKTGCNISIFTQKQSASTRVFKQTPITLHTGCTSEKKSSLISRAKLGGKIVAVVGDGMSDTQTLSCADVGIMLSGAETGTCVYATSVVVLGNNPEHIRTLIKIANKTVYIAKQSIYIGIGFSIIGIWFATAGIITPISGALLQKTVDVFVTLNTLRNKTAAQ